jgi:hypothetical protein
MRCLAAGRPTTDLTMARRSGLSPHCTQWRTAAALPRTRTILSVNLTKTRAQPLNDKEKLHELRTYTHLAASLADCMNALKEAQGDLDQAKALLVDRGFGKRKGSIFHLAADSNAPAGWSYIVTKAHHRKADGLGMPSADWDDDDLAAIESCFRQITEGRGYTRDNPVQGVGIGGFYAALSTLHFRLVEQRATLADDEQAFNDEMVFEHLADQRTLTLYNKVAKD